MYRSNNFLIRSKFGFRTQRSIESGLFDAPLDRTKFDPSVPDVSNYVSSILDIAGAPENMIALSHVLSFIHTCAIMILICVFILMIEIFWNYLTGKVDSERQETRRARRRIRIE